MILKGPEFKRDATQTALMGVFNIHVYYIDMNLYTLFHCQSKDKVGHSQEWKETERERGVRTIALSQVKTLESDNPKKGKMTPKHDALNH